MARHFSSVSGQNTSFYEVKSGKITVYPPDHDEAQVRAVARMLRGCQIVAYVLYWAKEAGMS